MPKSLDDIVFTLHPRHSVIPQGSMFPRTRKAILDDYWQRIWINH